MLCGPALGAQIGMSMPDASDLPSLDISRAYEASPDSARTKPRDEGGLGAQGCAILEVACCCRLPLQRSMTQKQLHTSRSTGRRRGRPLRRTPSPHPSRASQLRTHRMPPAWRHLGRSSPSRSRCPCLMSWTPHTMAGPCHISCHLSSPR